MIVLLMLKVYGSFPSLVGKLIVDSLPKLLGFSRVFF
jgi:hypothetical protein